MCGAFPPVMHEGHTEGDPSDHRWGIPVSQRQLFNAALGKKQNCSTFKHRANLSEETAEALLCIDINYSKVFQPERDQQAASIAQQRRNKHSEKSQKTLENNFIYLQIDYTNASSRRAILTSIRKLCPHLWDSFHITLITARSSKFCPGWESSRGTLLGPFFSAWVFSP